MGTSTEFLVPAAETPVRSAGAVRVGRNFVYRIGSQAASAVINVAAMILLGRTLGAQGFGDYSFYYALIPLLSNGAGLGLSISVTREIAREPARAPRLLGDAIILRLILCSILALGVAIVAPTFYRGRETLLLLIVAVAALFDFSQDVSIWVMRAHERLDLEARLLFVSQIIWFGIIAAGSVLHLGLTVLLGAAAVAYFVRALVGAWIVSRHFYRPEYVPDRKRLVALLMDGVPFGLALFGVVLYGRVGLLTLRSLGTSTDVSYYQVAYLLSQPFTFVATALAMAMFPQMARRVGHQPEELRSSLRRALKCQFLMGLPLTLALVVLADPLIKLLFHGNGFDNASAALRLMSLGITVLFLNHAARYTLAALDQQRAALAGVGVGITVNAILCALLIPRLGYPGACLAFLGAECAICIVCMNALAKHVRLADVARDALRPIAAALLAGLWIFALGFAHPIVVALAAAVTYVLALHWMHALTRGEMRVLRQVAQSFLGGIKLARAL